MKPRNLEGREYRVFYTNGVESSRSLNRSWFDQLYDIESHLGGHKLPNPQRYSLVRGLSISGITIQDFPDVGFYSSTEGPTGYTAGYTPEFDSNTYNTALAKMYERWRSGVDFSIDLGQRKQTKDMLKKGIDLLNYVRRFKLRDLKSWYRAWSRKGKKVPSARALGGKWLEFQYGWRPLAQELYDATIELSKTFRSHMILRGRATSTRLISVDVSDASFGTHVARGTHSNRVLFHCSFTPGTSASQLLANFTSLNPLSIAWELTPYSFVADWFLDVGGYLRNFETALLSNSNFLGGYVTEVARAELGFSDSVFVERTGVRTTHHKYSTTFSATFKRRTLLSSSPFPRVPSFEANLSSGRLLNAAALLSQYLGRK